MLSLRGPAKIEMVWLMLKCVVIEPKRYAQSRIMKYEEKHLPLSCPPEKIKEMERENRERRGSDL